MIEVTHYTVHDVLDALYNKEGGTPCYLYNSTNSLEIVNTLKTKFFVPTYRVKKPDVEAWVEKMKTNPPDSEGNWQIVTVTYNDMDGSEPRHGAAIYRAPNN